jgi:chromosome segregation ATPase
MELTAALAEATAARTAVEQNLVEADAEREETRQRTAADLKAAAERLATREMELTAALADANAARTAVEHKLVEADAEREETRQRTAADLKAAAERLATRERELTAALADANAARAAVEHKLVEADAEHEQTRQRTAADLTEAAERWATREMDLTAELADANAARTAVENQLVEAAAAHEQTRQRAAADLTVAAERLATREMDLTAALTDATAARTAVEHKLVEADAVHEQTRQRAAADLAAAAERQAALEHRLGLEINARTALEERLAAAETARRDADDQHATAVASLTARLGDVQAQHDAARARAASFEQQLADTTAVLEQARRDWTAALAGARERMASRERELSAAVAAANAGRAEVESRLADSDAAHEQTRQRAAADLARAAQQLASRESELGAALADANGARTALQGRLADAEAAHRQTQDRAQADAAAAGQRQAALEEQIGREQTAARALRDTLAQVEERSRLALEASRGDNAVLQLEIDGLRRQLDALRTHSASLRRDADRVPVLQMQLEESRKENRRQFERAPYGLFECTRDGAITRLNHSLARLLGYRTSADLRGRDVVASVFECAGDLRWLLERSASTGKLQSVETTLKTRDRRRVSVRLHALSADSPVVIAVEDLTRLSAVEQRLREAQRLEAVGRVASEVAVTCDSLLRDVTQGGQQWLARIEGDTPLRHQGEQLLGDVTRAAGYLRQFVAYGHRQIDNLEPVSVQRLLRDMEAVLKRVLGDRILLVLPKTTDLYEVDVESETVQRILVNVVNYARERMPHGGRVKIQLSTTLVDRRFLASHPKLRPGAHVLITITEVPGATRPALPIQLPLGQAAPTEVRPSLPERPGMDVGPLVALISNVGGHLWMSAQPAGDMTLEIHLPRRTVDEVMEPAVSGSGSGRGRQFSRWFRH